MKFPKLNYKGPERRSILSRQSTPIILSWFVIVGTFGAYIFLLVNGNPARLDDFILGRILGTMDMAFGMVLAYWIGTSKSSHDKDETIKAMSKT